MNSQKILAVLLSWSSLASQSYAQEASLAVRRPKAPVLVRPYLEPTVPPARLKNSERLHRLIRAGKLYLTVQDAIALAIENNLDLEVDRYGPLLAEWQVERQQAGGPLRGVTGGNSLVNQATNGQGVAGSQQSAGLSGGGNNTGRSGSGRGFTDRAHHAESRPRSAKCIGLFAHDQPATKHDTEPDARACGYKAHL